MTCRLDKVNIPVMFYEKSHIVGIYCPNTNILPRVTLKQQNNCLSCTLLIVLEKINFTVNFHEDVLYGSGVMEWTSIRAETSKLN